MTLDEWQELAHEVIDELDNYFLDLGKQITELTPSDKARDLYEKEKWVDLHSFFQTIWEGLPEHPKIRFGIFFKLCDCCSEFPQEEFLENPIEYRPCIECGKPIIEAESISGFCNGKCYGACVGIPCS